MVEKPGDVVIIGAGPAGLTAAYWLAKHGRSVRVLEADPTHVGGLSRTVTYKGFGFDIGGHRFFSKSDEVEKLWTEILPDDLLTRTRSSRIYYRGRFFSYPLKVGETLTKLGPYEASACMLSSPARKWRWASSCLWASESDCASPTSAKASSSVRPQPDMAPSRIRGTREKTLARPPGPSQGSTGVRRHRQRKGGRVSPPPGCDSFPCLRVRSDYHSKRAPIRIWRGAW